MLCFVLFHLALEVTHGQSHVVISIISYCLQRSAFCRGTNNRKQPSGAIQETGYYWMMHLQNFFRSLKHDLIYLWAFMLFLLTTKEFSLGSLLPVCLSNSCLSFTNGFFIPCYQSTLSFSYHGVLPSLLTFCHSCLFPGLFLPLDSELTRVETVSFWFVVVSPVPSTTLGNTLQVGWKDEGKDVWLYERVIYQTSCIFC